MNIRKFVFTGNLCFTKLDGEEVEIEVPPELYRIQFEANHRGEPARFFFEWNNARPGKPDNWVRSPMPFAISDPIEKAIADEDKEEQRRMVMAFDEEDAA
jgi:hypothetical protein